MHEIPDLDFTALSLVDYQVSGWHIFDLHISVRCRCCGESSIVIRKNVTDAEVETERAKFLAHGSVEKCFDILSKPLDSFIRFLEDKVGAYSPEDVFVPWPVSSFEITELLVEERNALTRRQAQTQKLAMWFVREILGREWQETDWRGPAMKHAKSLLERYDADTIAGCLEANRDGLIGDGFPIKFMTAIESSGEPSLIQQFLNYRNEAPPIYLEHDTQQWLGRKSKHYPELEADPEAPKVAKPHKARAKVAVQSDFGESL